MDHTYPRLQHMDKLLREQVTQVREETKERVREWWDVSALEAVAEEKVLEDRSAREWVADIRQIRG